MTRFSVLMAIYSKETPENLEQCLESLVIQTIPASEVVIVKDGILTDELEKTLLVWQQRLPIKVVGYQETNGLAYAMNYGIHYCNYELIARMDSDDICLKERFEIQIKYFNENPHVALVSGYICEFKYNPGDIKSVRKVPLDHDKIVRYLKWRNAFNHMAVIFKKSVVLSVGGYNDNLTYFEDYDLWIRLVQAEYKVSNIPEILVNVRIGNNMIGRRHGLAYAKKELSFLTLQKKRGFISSGEYCLLILLRLPLRLIPQKLLYYLYQLLRVNRVTGIQ